MRELLAVFVESYACFARIAAFRTVRSTVQEGLVSIAVDGLSSPDLVTALRSRGIRTHTRKADHYSGNILDPLGLPDAVRVSMCHYNSLDEVKTFLAAMREILDG